MRRAAGSILLVVGTILSLALMGGVYALWTATTATGGRADARAAALGAGNQPAVAVLGTAVSVSWTVTTLPDGAPVSGYEVTAYDASSGAPRAVAGTCAGLIADSSCTDLAVPSGQWRYAVVPREGAWAGSPSAPSVAVTVDTTPPVVAIAFPAAGGAYTNVQWNAGCTGGSGICGTAADALSGLSSVRVSVRRESTGLYWNGSSFASATEVLLTPTGTTSWRYAIAASSFPAQGTYTAQVVATDTAGNSATASATFAIDRSTPTVAISSPAASTTYGVAEFDATCGVCGTAADAASSVASVGVSIRQGSGSYWNGSAFASATEVLFPATGTTSWALPFAGAGFPANGTYTARALATDATGQTATQSRTFTMDVTRPAPTALALVNGGGTAGLGRISPGSDSIRITFGETLAVASMCSAWSGNTTNQTANAVVTVTDAGADDLLTVTAGGCALHIGPVSLGGSYVTATSTFAGTVTWTVSSRRITITIGAQSTGTLNATAQAAGTAGYTPDAAITDVRGNAVVTTPFTATGQRL
jgi:hypothetical protein